MGHRAHYGRVSEVQIAGTVLLRIDVPTENPAVFETHQYGGSAIFGLHPCTEDVARQMAARYRPRCVTPIAALPGPAYDAAEDDGPDLFE